MGKYSDTGCGQSGVGGCNDGTSCGYGLQYSCSSCGQTGCNSYTGSDKFQFDNSRDSEKSDANYVRVESDETVQQIATLQLYLERNYSLTDKLSRFFHPTRTFKDDLWTQIEAIKKLGKSNNPKALPYLTELLEMEESRHEQERQISIEENIGYSQCGPQYKSWNVVETTINYSHPNARGPLKSEYKFSEILFDGSKASLHVSEDFIKQQSEEKERHDEIDKLVKDSVENLKKSCK